MLAEKIKEFRLKSGMTQKELANKLFVTPQAVSRWESGDVEPSASTITSMAQIFGISIDVLFGNEPPEAKVVVKTETVYKEQPVVLGICERCNRPIYNQEDIVRKDIFTSGGHRSTTRTLICKNCDNTQKAAEHDAAVQHGLLQRKRSYVWSGIITALILILTLIITTSNNLNAGIIVLSIIISLLFFPFISCLFLQNNCVAEIFISVAGFGFVKMPGIIFSLDLDGIVWLLTVKLFLWILGIAIAILFTVAAIVICLVVSIFVYPYAIHKNIQSPELSND